MSKKDKASSFLITQRSALIIVSALSKVAIEELTKEMRYDGEPWEEKRLYLNLIGNFAYAAEVMLECEDDAECYICSLQERRK